MIPMFPKGYDKDKWYKVEEAMPGKELEEWPHGLLLSTKNKNSGKEMIQVTENGLILRENTLKIKL